MIPSTNWTDRAACSDVETEVFFPIIDRLTGRSRSPRRPDPYERARAICAGCEVKAECLDEALAIPWVDDQHGMFGGLEPRQRVPLRAQRRREGRAS